MRTRIDINFWNEIFVRPVTFY